MNLRKTFTGIAAGTAMLSLGACDPINMGSAGKLATGGAAGIAASEAAKAVGADDGTANAIGVVTGLFVVDQMNQREAQEGSCQFRSETVRGSGGSAWEERRVCVREGQGYRSGPQ